MYIHACEQRPCSCCSNLSLSTLVEEAVLNSQCGFRAGRGSIDMIFCICQLVEKAIEHNNIEDISVVH